MIEKENNQTRSKLTLKLKLPTQTAEKNLAPKVKKSSSAIEVTIKGRRSVQTKTEEKSTDRKLSQNELEARLRAVSDTSSNIIDEHNVLAKIAKTNEKKEIRKTEEIFVEKKTIVTNEAIVDSFDVRSEIKQSVEVSNKEKAEREKMLQERRRQEQERLEKERESK